jgi:hypothetical protein
MASAVINNSVGRDVGIIHRLYNWKELQHMYLYSIPAYVYIIRHIPSGKFYIGSRYKHVHDNIQPEDDLWKRYFTSSQKIRELRKESLDTDFNFEIVLKSYDSDECFIFEQNLIKDNINDPDCLNMRYFDVEKNERFFINFGKTLSTKGKPKPEKTKEKMRKPKSEQHRRNISEAQIRNGGNGPKKHSEESKNKTRETMKSLPRPDKTCPHCGKTGGFLSMSRWHFDKCRNKNE